MVVCKDEVLCSFTKIKQATCFPEVYRLPDNVEDTKSPSFLHLKKLSRDYWISITGTHPVKIHVWDFCGGSCESFNTLVHCDLIPPVGATSRGTARMTSSSKLSREAFWQTDWMQSLNSEGSFFQLQKERKGMRCVRESVTVEWRHSNGLRVSITYVKSNLNEMIFASLCTMVLHLNPWREVRNYKISDSR